jgi:hypothetical protein
MKDMKDMKNGKGKVQTAKTPLNLAQRHKDTKKGGERRN